jgi:outer membrane protein assembly factor BamA
MKHNLLLLLAATLLLSVCLPAEAQKIQPKTIEFKGAPEYSVEELLAAAGLKEGTVLDYSDMKDHSQKLMDTGLFETAAWRRVR